MRVVDDSGNQLGILTKSDALQKAEESGLDLVLVAGNITPPVAKIIDFAKFKYQHQQKQSAGKKKSKQVDIKEIRMTPFIADGDLNVRIKKAREFLDDGNKVKINVKFVGRQITRKSFGENLLNKALAQLSDIADIEREPSFQGKVLSTQLQPKRKK